MQKTFYLYVHGIGDNMGMNTEEWPDRTKKKVLLVMGIIVVLVLVSGIFA
jgi:hypothetical protein